MHVCYLLQNGVLLRSVLDSVTGDMSDTRTRYIGSKPVKLFRISMQGNEAVRTNVYDGTGGRRIPMSSRSWPCPAVHGSVIHIKAVSI